MDLVPERYDRKTVEEAIAAVPPGLVDEGPLMWGTPEQISHKLEAVGEAGMRHVVLAPVSGLVSRRAALYGLWATKKIARSLSGGR